MTPDREINEMGKPTAVTDGDFEQEVEKNAGLTVVDFWATWCGPCRMEMPELAEVWTENRDRCFELLGVAEESGREDVLRAAPSIPYPILLDERAEALESWGVQGYPITVLVDPEGRVRQTFRGALSKRRLESAIRPLLPATCPAKS